MCPGAGKPSSRQLIPWSPLCFHELTLNYAPHFHNPKAWYLASTPLHANFFFLWCLFRNLDKGLHITLRTYCVWNKERRQWWRASPHTWLAHEASGPPHVSWLKTESVVLALFAVQGAHFVTSNGGWQEIYLFPPLVRILWECCPRFWHQFDGPCIGWGSGRKTSFSFLVWLCFIFQLAISQMSLYVFYNEQILSVALLSCSFSVYSYLYMQYIVWCRCVKVSNISSESFLLLN